MPSSSHYNAEIFYEDELLRINLFVVYQIYELKQSQKPKKMAELAMKVRSQILKLNRSIQPSLSSYSH